MLKTETRIIKIYKVYVSYNTSSIQIQLPNEVYLHIINYSQRFPPHVSL